MDEFEVGSLKRDIDLSMDELAGLFLGCFGDGWVAMAEIGDADAGGEIEHLTASDHGDIAAGTALDDFSRETSNAFGYVFSTKLC